MTVAMVIPLMLSSLVSGKVITRTGVWKRWLVGGMVLVVAALALLGTIDESTHLVVVGLFMAILGLGMGATMQNLVLAVQNNVAVHDLGAASSVVAFFRSMGGSAGVSVLGAILGTQVADRVAEGYRAAQQMPSQSFDSHAIPDLSTLPGWEAGLWEHAFGASIGELYLIAAPAALVAFLCVLFIKEVPLRTSVGMPENVAPEATAEASEGTPSR